MRPIFQAMAIEAINPMIVIESISGSFGGNSSLSSSASVAVYAYGRLAGIMPSSAVQQ